MIFSSILEKYTANINKYLGNKVVKVLTRAWELSQML